MAARAHREPGEVVVHLTGLDALLTGRRRIALPLDAGTQVTTRRRDELEPRLDHRVAGTGSHVGERGQGRRRVGAFLGRDRPGRQQLWATPAGDTEVVVVDRLGEGGSGVARFVLGRSVCDDGLLALADQGDDRRSRSGDDPDGGPQGDSSSA